VPFFLQVLQRAGDARDCGPQLLDQAKPGIGQRYAARRAVQQAHPEVLLELPHRVAERRGGDTETRCCGTEAAIVGNSDERGQIGKVAAGPGGAMAQDKRTQSRAPSDSWTLKAGNDYLGWCSTALDGARLDDLFCLGYMRGLLTGINSTEAAYKAVMKQPPLTSGHLHPSTGPLRSGRGRLGGERFHDGCDHIATLPPVGRRIDDAGSQPD
jgi:hypothetical protein